MSEWIWTDNGSGTLDVGDGRTLRVWGLLGGWWVFSVVVNGIATLQSTEPVPTRDEAVAAVERAAGVRRDDATALMADAARGMGRERDDAKAREVVAVLALQNCRAMAAREVRKCPPGPERQAWEHVLRFCAEGGVAGSVLRRDKFFETIRKEYAAGLLLGEDGGRKSLESADALIAKYDKSDAADEPTGARTSSASASEGRGEGEPSATAARPASVDPWELLREARGSVSKLGCIYDERFEVAYYDEEMLLLARIEAALAEHDRSGR